MRNFLIVLIFLGVLCGCSEDDPLATNSNQAKGISAGEGVSQREYVAEPSIYTPSVEKLPDEITPTSTTIPTSTLIVSPPLAPTQTLISDQTSGPSPTPVTTQITFPEVPDQTVGLPVNAICKTSVTVNFRFVIDITTSMKDVFPFIKNNASAFDHNALAALNTSSTENVVAQYSISKFEDGVPNQATHGSLMPFVQFVSALDALRISTRDDNGDWPENGLTAVESLINIIDTNAVVTVIIFVSDNFAHSGGARFSRDYSLFPLQNIVNSKITGDPVFLFDATKTSQPTDDPHFNNQILPSYASVPADQWNLVREQNKGKLIGKGIGFPLSTGALTTEIANFIKDFKAKTCK